MKKYIWTFVLTVIFAVLIASPAFALSETTVVDVQKYDRSIQIMAMLLVGFGFLMVFLKKYGRSALTATFLLVSVAIPLYMLIDSTKLFGVQSISEIDRFILAEFAGASLLICAGACLGRLKMYQYILLAILFIPLYMTNEWILAKNGLGLIGSGAFIDTGGSIIIHAFGALFGLGVVLALTDKKAMPTLIDSDFNSDRFSLLGSMVLWVFWPSFCAALVEPALVTFTAVNVVIALCGSTLAAYVVTVSLRRKISVSDIANASLAGGVAIGATCASANHPTAFVIGILAGTLSTFGFAIIQARLEKSLKVVDTCGVTNLHGWPGLLGGLAAIIVIPNIQIGAELSGIGIMILMALIPGYFVGRIVLSTGRIDRHYDDATHIIDFTELTEEKNKIVTKY